jgi:hypothetical protein
MILTELAKLQWWKVLIILNVYFLSFCRLDHVNQDVTACNKSLSFHLIGDFSSDAQFFVATGVLSVLYCIGIVLVYVMLDAMYQSTGLLPLAVRLHHHHHYHHHEL